MILSVNVSFNLPETDLTEWGEQVLYKQANPVGEVTIGMVGKYTELPDAYKSVNEAFKTRRFNEPFSVSIKYIDSQDVETKGVEVLKGVDGILFQSLDLSWCRG